MKVAVLFFIPPFLFITAFGQTVEARIDSLMKSYYSSSEPGAVLAITQQGKSVFKKSYGLADIQTGKPITADANFNIGSLTKQFTSFALLELNEEGKFALSDSIGKFFQLPAALASIRISQLLSHSSGLPDHYGYTDTFRVKHATDKDVLAAIQSADTLYFTSGTRYRYSNTAYCLLALLIEKLSGKTYPAFLQQEIFAPLGISDATVFQYRKPITRRVTGYEKTKEGKFINDDAEESIFYSTEADGGIYISMNNYLKWCLAVESGIFYKTNMMHYAWQQHTAVNPAHGLWYGAGWFIQRTPDSLSPKIIFHTGFNGGFRTVVYMIPSIRYCISIFSNRGDIDLEELVRKINHILSIPDNSFIKSGPLESFIHTWPIFAPCKETSSFSTSFIKNLNAKGMVLN